uniref:Uncharacterized protein n=1 Tax=Arundo donax TaxID=35708 RepID=A0A0A8Z6A9_ARUDO
MHDAISSCSCTRVSKHLHAWPASLERETAAGDVAPAAAGAARRGDPGAVRGSVAVLHQDVAAPALLAAERPVTSVDVYVHAVAELLAAEEAPLQERAARRRRRRRHDGSARRRRARGRSWGDPNLVGGGGVHEGGLAYDLSCRRRSRRCACALQLLLLLRRRRRRLQEHA